MASTTYKNLGLLFTVCFLSNVLGGTVSTLMSVYLPVVVKDVFANQDNDFQTLSAYINSIFIFGWALGGFTWGIIADKIGRRKALLSAITVYGLFTIATGFMQHWTGIVICRFCSGFGVGGIAVISYTLLSEVWPENKRSVVIGIQSIAFPVGIVSAGMINYFVADWRSGFFVGLLPLLLAVIGFFSISESPAWLQRFSVEKDNSTRSLFSPAHRKDLISSAIIYGTMLISLWAIFAWLPTWVQSLINNADAQKERGLSMMLLGLGGLVGGFFSGWIVKITGVQRSMLVCFSTCAILSFILFKTNNRFTPFIYAEIGILSIFFGLNMGILSSYIPALFPPGIRASATGFALNLGRIFTGLAVLFVGVLVSAMGGFGNALLIFSMIFLVGLSTVIFFKPQTIKS